MDAGLVAVTINCNSKNQKEPKPKATKSNQTQPKASLKIASIWSSPPGPWNICATEKYCYPAILRFLWDVGHSILGFWKIGWNNKNGWIFCNMFVWIPWLLSLCDSSWIVMTINSSVLITNHECLGSCCYDNQQEEYVLHW